MKKEWEVNSRGKKHTIVYETGKIAKATVDGIETELRSQTPWLNLIDYQMWVGHEDVRLVVVGKKVDLAVNGTYRESGEKYEPLNPIPRVLNALVFMNAVGGAFMGGVFCGLLGIIFGTFYAKAAVKGGKIRMYLTFMICTLLQVVWCVLRK